MRDANPGTRGAVALTPRSFCLSRSEHGALLILLSTLLAPVDVVAAGEFTALEEPAATAGAASDAQPAEMDRQIVRGERAEKLDEYFSRLMELGFSGSMLVAERGEVFFAKGYGMADRENNVPFTTQTAFDIGSITKQFTASAILKLEMQGKLSVEDKLTKFFDDVPADKSEITLHQLLTHSSGMRDGFGFDYQRMPRDVFIKLAMGSKLLWKPGEQYRYSNAGYSILGIIIEKLTGATYERFLHDELFEPAGMRQTGYRMPDWKQQRVAHGYQRGRDWGTPLDKRWDKDGPYWNLRANGGILSTVWDMYRWHLALQGEEILNKEAKEKQFAPHVREGPDAVSYYGYGWVWVKTPRDTLLNTHNGGNGIFFADFRRYVEDDVVFILATSTAADLPPGRYRWERNLISIVFGEEYQFPPAEAE